jgi:hypothetical protein
MRICIVVRTTARVGTRRMLVVVGGTLERAEEDEEYDQEAATS